MSAAAPQPQPFLPDFCEQGSLLRTMVMVELLAFVLVAGMGGGWSERLHTLALLSLFIQWIAVVDIALLCGARDWLARLDDRVAAVAAFVLLQAVTVTFTLIAHALAVRLTLPLATEGLTLHLLENGAISAIASAIVLRYFYVTAQWRRQVEAAASARLQALQARIRPHFLFNSLNTIAELTRADAATAEGALEDLSDLFRASLAGRETLTLAEELALVASYLRLEGQRLGERLRVAWSTDPRADAVAVPALLLQPLAENAVYHGIEQCPQGGELRIETRREAQAVSIAITNPLPHTRRPSQGHRMAQENIRQRLAYCYGERARMEASADDASYHVALRIPLEPTA